MNPFAGVIEKRVMKVVREHIAQKEKEYEEGVEKINLEAEQKKEELADNLVDGILGKII